MPTYSFRDTTNDQEFDRMMSNSDRELFLKENPHIKQVLKPVAFGDSVRMGLRKPDDGFREVLQKGKEAHKYNTINDF